MKRYSITKIAVIIGMTVMVAFSATACGNKQETNSSQQAPSAEEVAAQAEKDVAQAEKEAQAIVEQAEKDVQAVEDLQAEMLADYTGEMDLAGSWDDEVSQRASMDVTANDDGSYEIVVHWGSSATETAIWQIHGSYDAVSGMLTYEDGAYSIHTWDANNNETVSGEETTKGAFLKEGSKLRWQDSKNSEDGVFVKE